MCVMGSRGDRSDGVRLVVSGIYTRWETCAVEGETGESRVQVFVDGERGR